MPPAYFQVFLGLFIAFQLRVLVFQVLFLGTESRPWHWKGNSLRWSFSWHLEQLNAVRRDFLHQNRSEMNVSDSGATAIPYMVKQKCDCATMHTL